MDASDLMIPSGNSIGATRNQEPRPPAAICALGTWLGDAPSWLVMSGDPDARIRQESERRDALVNQGDVRSLLDEMAAREPGAIVGGFDFVLGDPKRQLHDLAAAVQNRARQDPDGLTRDVLTETAGLLALVVLRGHCFIHRRLALLDQHSQGGQEVWASGHLQEDLLPAIARLSLQLAEIRRELAGAGHREEPAPARQAPSVPCPEPRSQPDRPVPPEQQQAARSGRPHVRKTSKPADSECHELVTTGG